MEGSDYSMQEIRTIERQTKERERKEPLLHKEKRNKCLIWATVSLFILTSIIGYNSLLPNFAWEEWKDKLNMSNSSFSYLWMVEGGGMVAGSFLCSIIPCCNFMVGVGGLLTTFFPIPINKTFLFFSFFLGGFGKGIVFVCGIKTMHLWAEPSIEVVIQLLFLFHSSGGLVATQTHFYYHSFQSKPISNFINNYILKLFSYLGFTISSSEVFIFQFVFIFVALGILGFYVVWSCCCRTSCCSCSSKKENNSTLMAYEDFNKLKTVNLTLKSGDDVSGNVNFSKKFNIKKWFPSNRLLDVSCLMFLFIHFFFAWGVETLLLKFCFRTNYIFSSEKLIYHTSDEFMATLICSMFIVGRFVSIFFSKSFSSNGIIAACIVFNVISSVTMCAYYNKSEGLIIFCIASLSFFSSPLFPAGFTWANMFLANSHKSLGLAVCCAGLGGLVASWVTGFLSSLQSQVPLIFYLAAAHCFSALTFVPLLVKVRKQPKTQNINKHLVTYV